MKLILSGGGIGEKSSQAYSLFAKELNGGKVLLIPLADEDENYDEDYSWFKTEVAPYGIKNIYMVRSADEITSELLQEMSGIYFEGGNTFLLLQLLKESNAFEEIKKAINSDKVIMGGSAGALIFGKSIETIMKDDLNVIVSDDNIVGLEDFSGFNVLNGYSLFVHYRLKDYQYEVTEEKVQRLIKSGYKLICLPEEDSLVVNDGNFYLIGDKPAEIVCKNKRKELLDRDELFL